LKHFIEKKSSEAPYRSWKPIPELQSWSMKYLVNNNRWTREKKIDEIHFSGFAGPSASSVLVKHAAVD
jgi:hypothetical protein